MSPNFQDLLRQILLAACLLYGMPMAQAAQPALFANSACLLTPGGATAPQTCEKLARAISHDIDSVRALGHELELRGRYTEAVATYQVALSVHPNHRDLLQRLIRARGEAREMALLAPTPVPSKSSGQCWSGRFAEALDDCRAQLKTTPNDVSLHERAGDLLRGLGQIDAALTAYDAVLRLNPRAEAARRKRTALATLVKNEPLLSSSAQPALQAQAGPTVPSPLATPDVAPPAGTQANVSVYPNTAARPNTTPQSSAPLQPNPSPQSIASAATPAANAPAPRAANSNAIASAANLGRFRALIIGNERYKDFPRLRSPLSDATAIAELLKREYGFEVNLLTNATRYQTLSALSQLRKEATGNDNVLVYYAGHGYLDEVTSRGYWLPVDAERESVANWISTNDVADALAGLQAKHAMIVADSCFSGTLLRGDASAALDERNALILRIAARRSRTIMTSGGLEPVVDDGDGKHSVFAEAFLGALSSNRDLLEAGRLFVQIRDHVAARATQTPQYGPIQSAGHEGGDFIFVRSSRTPQ